LIIYLKYKIKSFKFFLYFNLPVSVFVEVFKLRVSAVKWGAVGILVNCEIVGFGLFDRFELPGTFNVELDAVLLSFESKNTWMQHIKEQKHDHFFLFEVCFFG